jgi:hypothetical protein
MTPNHASYYQGIRDAKQDLAEGWIDETLTADYIRNQLEVMVGATPEYIEGYLTVVGV